MKTDIILKKYKGVEYSLTKNNETNIFDTTINFGLFVESYNTGCSTLKKADDYAKTLINIAISKGLVLV